MIKKRLLKQLQNKDFYQSLLKENESLKKRNTKLEKTVKDNRDVLKYYWVVKPGHFYSPLVGDDEAKSLKLLDLKKPRPKEVNLPGINFNKTVQFKFLEKLSKQYSDFQDLLSDKSIRYTPENDQFGEADASFLYLMMRHFKPKRIIEVGSGWSSALMLDTNNRYPKDAADLTFIEPNPQRLYKALRASDKKQSHIITKNVQTIDISSFKKLKEDDILFIDGSHVSKTGSDVNYLFLKVLPQLNKGVIIHVHDILYPFEYPLQWVVDEKRNWNEAYMLQSLLIGSNMFEILLWPNYLVAADGKRTKKLVPPASIFGVSIWLRKVL